MFETNKLRLEHSLEKKCPRLMRFLTSNQAQLAHFINKSQPKLMHLLEKNQTLIGVVFLTWLSFYFKYLVGDAYTGWDSHDHGFINFLYFGDSLKTGSIPLWNPFIQSGTFFANFYNVGFFTPFQLPFIFLSWVINPVIAFELLLQSAILAGGVGGYLLFRCMGGGKKIALFGTMAYCLSVLLPVVGQMWFLFSWASLPWLILACHKISKAQSDRLQLRYAFWGGGLGLYITCGYPWLNITNLIIVFMFSLVLLKRNIPLHPNKSLLTSGPIKNFILFFGAIGVTYACMEIPTLISTNFYYGIFSGDYISPEPRLRGLGAVENHFYGNIYTAITAAIDPRISVNNDLLNMNNPRWSFGAGWVLWILLLATPWKKSFTTQQIFWASALVFFLLYSAGQSSIAAIISHIPLLNANRWWWVGSVYVSFILSILVVWKLIQQPQKTFEKTNSHYIRISLVALLVFSYLIYASAPPIEFLIVAATFVVLWKSGTLQKNSWTSVMVSLLLLINCISFISMRSDISKMMHRLDSVHSNYLNSVKSRNQDVTITENHRQVEEGAEYQYMGENWVLGKVPVTHGFNPIGSPLYWYLRNLTSLQQIVFLTQSVRLEADINRSHFNSDNAFAKAITQDVLRDPNITTIDKQHFQKLDKNIDFKWTLNHFTMNPNSIAINVTTNDSAFLVLNNTYHPGWRVFINGKAAEPAKVNRVFQGVFLKGSGNHNIEFKFQPTGLIILLATPYLLLIILTVFYIRREWFSPSQGDYYH
ncbi:YfhO family protein [Mariprofundus ferrooxydans]|uniref:YfhO family protein n=1 Tax=Mariprofundus ferrooxydans TaxID=314344 RepID=UPI00036325FA|nr:YfhO family protein [Mariprofundus ferrooxydans]